MNTLTTLATNAGRDASGRDASPRRPKTNSGSDASPTSQGRDASPRRPRAVPTAFTLIELLVVIAILGILAALLLPTLGRGNAQAQNAVCLSQLRQLGIAARLYADDFNNRMPSAELLPSTPIDPANPKPRICDVLSPQLSRSGATTNSSPVFKCPSDTLGRYKAEGSSYEWNIELNGRRMDETSSKNLKFMIITADTNGTTQTNGTIQLLFPPDTTPLFVDYDDFHRRSAPSGKNVVFMDGHVTPLQLPPDQPEAIP